MLSPPRTELWIFGDRAISFKKRRERLPIVTNYETIVLGTERYRCGAIPFQRSTGRSRSEGTNPEGQIHWELGVGGGNMMRGDELPAGDRRSGGSEEGSSPPEIRCRRTSFSLRRVSQAHVQDDRKILNAMHENGSALVIRGEHEVALDVFRRVYEERRSLLGEDDISTLSTRNQMAWTLMSQGNLHEALLMFGDVYGRSRRHCGEDEELTLVARDNMAYVLSRMGRYADALEVYKGVHEREVRLYGEEHPRNLVTKQSMAALHFHLGHYGVAMEMFRVLREETRKVFGAGHPITLKNKEFMDEIKRLNRASTRDSCSVM